MENDGTSEIFCFDEEQLSTSYTQFELIYSGPNSQVMRAKRDGQWWTLKCLSQACQGMEVYRNLQQKEFNIQSSLHHPHLAQAFRLEQVEGYGRCLVMEWVDGQNLRQWLATHPRKSERRRVLNQLISALGYLHKQQVVHRDLKPENIMVTRNGSNVKIIDFGLADTDYYDDLKQPSGTIGYMAPEQATERTTDCSNDIYSLGCIIADMELGRPYTVLAQRCTLPKEQRLQTIADVEQFLAHRRLLRRLALAFVAVVIVALAAWGIYQVQEYNGRPRYQEVAQFRVANVKYTSWGGLAASAQLCAAVEEQVYVPANVTYKGLTYNVSELGFDSFRNDTMLRRLVVTIEADTMNILRGSFKGCSKLTDLYFDYDKIIGIGSKIWPCPIDSLFDAHHFNDVTLHVHPAVLRRYQQSEWRRFKRIETF